MAQSFQSKQFLLSALQEAQRLMDRDRPEEVIELLEPLLSTHRKNADLHILLGSAHGMAGDLWQAAIHLQRAEHLDPAVEIRPPPALLYTQLGLFGLALQGLRKVRQRVGDNRTIDDVQLATQLAEDYVANVAKVMEVSREKVQRGLVFFDLASLALHDESFARCLKFSRQALKLLGDFSPALNNLSTALFYSGRPRQALETARGVLEREPENVHALANLIRFLAWAGEEGEARAYWERLRGLKPIDQGQLMVMAEAAAAVEDDRAVYDLLKGSVEEDPDVTSLRGQFMLAVAAANLGLGEAEKRLKSLAPEFEHARDILEAVRAGRPGLGWASRFSYFSLFDVLPTKDLLAFFTLLERKGGMEPGRFRRQLKQFAKRFPQVVMVGEKMLMEQQDPEAGIALLVDIGTPEAYKILREFGLGRAGDDRARLLALMALCEAGQIAADEPVRVWLEGEWREVVLGLYRLEEQEEGLPYAERAIRLLEEALEALDEGNDDEAERLLLEVVALEPRAKEAYNNLGAIYARREEHERAKEMMRKALEIDPHYVMPRCNLAIYMLSEGDVDGAEQWIAPLWERTTMRPIDMALLSFVSAQIHWERREFDAVRASLEMALQAIPEYEPAMDLLEHLEGLEKIKSGMERMLRESRRRAGVKRRRLQDQLTSPDHSLEECLSIYTKDALTAIGRNVILEGGWSTLRKAELLRRIVLALGEERTLRWILHGLEAEAREALAQVLAAGGSMAWETFAAAWDHDLEEWRDWKYYPPGTVMGSLRSHGLMVEATVDGELVVMVPRELRGPLQELLEAGDFNNEQALFIS